MDDEAFGKLFTFPRGITKRLDNFLALRSLVMTVIHDCNQVSDMFGDTNFDRILIIFSGIIHNPRQTSSRGI